MKTTIRTAILLAMIIGTAVVASSCSSTKYVNCDAYKTHYPKIKADNHKRHHHTCDAYN